MASNPVPVRVGQVYVFPEFESRVMEISGRGRNASAWVDHYKGRAGWISYQQLRQGTLKPGTEKGTQVDDIE